MKNVKKMIQAGLKKFTVITILGVFLMTSLDSSIRSNESIKDQMVSI